MFILLFSSSVIFSNGSSWDGADAAAAESEIGPMKNDCCWTDSIGLRRSIIGVGVASSSPVISDVVIAAALGWCSLECVLRLSSEFESECDEACASVVDPNSTWLVVWSSALLDVPPSAAFTSPLLSVDDDDKDVAVDLSWLKCGTECERVLDFDEPDDDLPLRLDPLEDWFNDDKYCNSATGSPR